jgi:hypothetical protein
VAADAVGIVSRGLALAIRFAVCRTVGIALGVMLVNVVAKVAHSFAAFMLAILGCGTPDKLERQEREQEHDEGFAHETMLAVRPRRRSPLLVLRTPAALTVLSPPCLPLGSFSAKEIDKQDKCDDHDNPGCADDVVG